MTPTLHQKHCASLDCTDWERIKRHLTQERKTALSVARINNTTEFMTARYIARARAVLVRRHIQLAIVRAHHRRIDAIRGAAQ